MYIKENPVLGSIFARYSLRLNGDGLHRRIKVDGQPELLIPITDDASLICDVLGLDFEKFDKASREESFILIMGMPTFAQYLFLDRKETVNTTLAEFREFVKTNMLVDNTFFPITTARVEHIVGIELEEEIFKAKYIFKMYPTIGEGKFNDMKLKLIEYGYNPRNFSTDIPRFKEYFETKFEYMQYMVDTDLKEVLDKFLSLSVDNNLI